MYVLYVVKKKRALPNMGVVIYFRWKWLFGMHDLLPVCAQYNNIHWLPREMKPNPVVWGVLGGQFFAGN